VEAVAVEVVAAEAVSVEVVAVEVATMQVVAKKFSHLAGIIVVLVFVWFVYQLFSGYIQIDAYVEMGTATWGNYQPIQLQILLSLAACLLAYCPFSATDKGLGTTRRQTAAKAAARQGHGKSNNQPLAKAKAMAAMIHNNNVSCYHCKMINWAIMQ